nr:hypothetical protein [Tanacetum cinerariifolium]
MATTIEQQVALGEALVPSAQRLRIGRSNFRLPSDIQSKESTLQVATAKLHQHSIRFKMDTRKHVLDLEALREMLHLSPRIPGQSFAEFPFEEEILEFLRFLRHNTQIKTLTDVNVNKLYQPWRSFAAVINKCLTEATLTMPILSGKILCIKWNTKIKRRATRDDILFSTIKVVSRHQDTQQYGAILPIELTTEDIKNTTAYQEYYACATGEAAPKPKARARKKKAPKPKASAKKKTSGSALSTTHPTPLTTSTPTTTVVAAPRLSAATKCKQPARATTPTEPTDVERTEAEQLKIILKRSKQETHISQQHGSDTDERTAPKPKASARKKKGGSAYSTTPPTPIATPTPTTTVVAAPRLSAVAKGKQPARARSPTEPSDVERTEAEQLKIILRRSRHETHISQQVGSSTDEGTGSRLGVPDVPSDDSEEELSWNS